MVIHRLVLIAGMIVVISHILRSQERPEPFRFTERSFDSLQRKNIASINFSKYVDTYHWIGTAIYEKRYGPLLLTLNEQFHSTIATTIAKHITDVQNLTLTIKNRLKESLNLVGKIQSFSISDNLDIGISNVSSRAVYGGIEYRLMPSLSITPLIGMRFEHQSDQNDKGVSYLVNLSSDSLVYQGYKTDISGNYQYDKLTPRIVETRHIGFTAEKIFFERTRNVFQFTYARNRRDFYSPVDSTIMALYNITLNIDTRLEDAFVVSDLLEYNVGRSLLLTFQGNIFTRSIDRATKYKNYSFTGASSPNTTTQELKIEGGLQANYAPEDRFNAMMRFFYQERDEDHQVQFDEKSSTIDLVRYTELEQRKNNHSRRTTLASTVAMALSSSNTISLAGSASVLRYDTPSMRNDDDRDELWYVVGITTSHRFNQHLRVQFSADAHLTHLVYLSSKSSADNTWNRIFRFSPRVEYTPSASVTSINTFEVLANYTVYDFEFPASPIRSFAFRQFGFIDSTGLQLTRRFGVEFYGHIRLYERGELLWEEFSEHPLNYFEDKTYIGVLRYNLTERLLFSVGIRYFSQTQFRYDGNERVFENILRSVGPVSTIRLETTGHMGVYLTGWFEHQTGSQTRDIANMTMSLSLHI